jgi:hypothetical protein
MPSKGHLWLSGSTTFALDVGVSEGVALVYRIPDLDNEQSAMTTFLSVIMRRGMIILFAEFMFGVVCGCCWIQAPICAVDISWTD